MSAEIRVSNIQQIPAQISPVLFLGQVVHLTLHRFFIPALPFRSEKGLHDLFRESWKEERAKYRAQNLYQLDRDTEREHGLKGLDMLSRFFHSPFQSQPHATETMVKTRMREDIQFTGKIDRLEQWEGGFKIVDYKTGKYHPRYLDTFQLHTYAWLMARSGYRVMASGFYYLEDDAAVEEPITEEILQEAEKNLYLRVMNLITVLEQGVFATKPSKLCGWCDYQDLCPEGRYGQ